MESSAETVVMLCDGSWIRIYGDASHGCMVAVLYVKIPTSANHISNMP